MSRSCPLAVCQKMSATMPHLPEPQMADGTDKVTQQNLRTVAEMEKKAGRERTPGERIVDATASTVGTVHFWAAHLVVIALWAIMNSGHVLGVTPWDPWPYETLRTVLPLEATIISCTVLMIQGRMKRQQAQRTHLDLQISLLQEREATKTLHLLMAICQRLEIPDARDPELADLIRFTDPNLLHDEVKEKLVTS